MKPAITIFNRQDMDGAFVQPLAGGAVAVFSGRHPGAERDNEDGAALIALDDGRGVLAVADGLGGQPSGAEAAAIALQVVAECVIRAAGADEPGLRAAILDGFERASERIAGLGVGAGTTLAAVQIEGRVIRTYHVGDSAILAVGQRGKVRLMTVAHSPVGYGVEAGLLNETQAIHHEDRHIVSNIVGAPDMRIEVGRTLPLRPRDTVMLGSDGVFDNLRLEEIVGRIRKGPLERAAASLVEACRARMTADDSEHPSKPDDLTFLIYRPTARIGPRPGGAARRRPTAS